MRNLQATAGQTARGWKRPILIVLTFLLLGPAIGYYVVAIGGLAVFPPGPDFWPGLLLNEPFFLLFAYIVGGAQALFAGIIAAISYCKRGDISFLWVISAALLCSIVTHLVLPDASFLVAIAHIVAAALCWLTLSKRRTLTP